MRTPNGWMPAKVTQVGPEPRSYHVQKGDRVYRRNRRDILQAKELESDVDESPTATSVDASMCIPSQDNVPVHVPHAPVREEQTKPVCASMKEQNVKEGKGKTVAEGPSMEPKMYIRCGREVKLPFRFK